MPKVLILGAGMVARPIVQNLLDHGINLTVCDYQMKNAEAVIMNRRGATPLHFDVNNDDQLDQLVQSHDLVVSLLPYIYHVKVAQQAIEHGKDMLTASYASPEMLALDGDAKKRGIIILNELGLDPGIDHMSAMKIIDEVHDNGGKVNEFYSYCGALSAPEAATNPFRYKFTWSPRGVVLASGNAATYKLNGKVIKVDGKNLFRDIRKINVPETGEMEVYPNRDSISYQELYGISEAQTILRGTIRYPGWCRIMDAIKSLGFLSQENRNFSGLTYADVPRQLAGINGSDQLEKFIARHFNISKDDEIIKGMQWLGLLEDEQVDENYRSLFDVLAGQMISKMMLSENERDMVLLLHSFQVIRNDGRRQLITSKLIDFGTPETDTAIARTVALPVAVGVKLLLDNKINLKGVYIPVLREIYEPVLNGLKDLGIKMVEDCIDL